MKFEYHIHAVNEIPIMALEIGYRYTIEPISVFWYRTKPRLAPADKEFIFNKIERHEEKSFSFYGPKQTDDSSLSKHNDDSYWNELPKYVIVLSKEKLRLR